MPLLEEASSEESIQPPAQKGPGSSCGKTFLFSVVVLFKKIMNISNNGSAKDQEMTEMCIAATVQIGQMIENVLKKIPVGNLPCFL